MGSDISRLRTDGLASGGIIDLAEARDLRKAAKGDKGAVQEILATANLTPDARLELQKALGKTPPPKASNLAGATVEKNGTAKGTEAFVTRTLSPPEGYGTEYEALAAARLSGAKNSAIVRDKGDRWHAVETNKAIVKSAKLAADQPITEVKGVPAYDKTKVAELRRDLAAAKASKNGDDIVRLRKELALAVFGVSVNFIRRESDRQAGEINIIDLPSGIAGRHGPGQCAHCGFSPGKKSAVEIDIDALDTGKPDPIGVLFHEASHQADFDLAQTWVAAYEKSGRAFSPGPDGDPAFTAWIMQQAGAKKLSMADAMVAAEATKSGVTGSTEARAYLTTFLAAVRAGDTTVATQQLATWAKHYGGNIPSGSLQAENAMFRTLENAYRDLPLDKQAAFDAAMNDAKTEAVTYRRANKVANPDQTPLHRFDHKTAANLKG